MRAMPSVHAIRAALERVVGAMRDEPLAEDSAEGLDPAVAVYYYDPEDHMREAAFTYHALDRVTGPDFHSVQVFDSPNVLFEIPPELTDADIWNALGREGEHLKQLAQVRGIDAYGWYVTFHQRSRHHGVYIPVERLIIFALQAFKAIPLKLERKLEIAFYAVLRHELFHFEADCMAANWELSTGEAVYWPGRVDWHKEFEEALANAYMLRGVRYREGSLRDARGSYRALKAFCELQPPGYRDGPRYAKSRVSYIKGCRDLSFVFRCMAEGEGDWEVNPDALDTAIFFPNPFRIDWQRCPIIINDKLGILKTLGIDLPLFEAITGIIESQSFLKTISRLGPRIEAIWHRRKADLARSVKLNGLGFERWKPGGRNCYSVRLDGNFRAHLRRDLGTECWIAESIGDHKSMGHG